LLHAAGVAGKFSDGAELQVDAAAFQLRANAAPVAEKMLTSRRVESRDCGIEGLRESLEA
jgi:hypothetical protein